MTERFTGNFTQQEGLSEEAIEAAVRVMRTGRLPLPLTFSPADCDQIGRTIARCGSDLSRSLAA